MTAHISVEEQEHTNGIVPIANRRSPLTLGLLWVTMVTGFPTVLIGFDWFKQGITLSQLLPTLALSCCLLLLYAIPACFLGAKSGQTYGVLARNVFGRWGSWMVSFNLMWVCIAWYGLNALFLAEGLRGLLGLTVPTVVLAAGLAIVMAFNNLFGFSGVANFARYLAAPILMVWVAITFGKSLGTFSPSIFAQHEHQSIAQVLTVVSSFVLGYGCWGNEADYWRYSKPKPANIVIPLVVAILIGLVIFPITGFLIAQQTGITDYAAATNFMNQYAFGGMSVIAAIVLTVAYFAVNDSGLYGAINAQENILALPRRKVVIGLMLAGTVAAVILSNFHDALELVASISCVFLPSATVIVLTEWIFAAVTQQTRNFARLMPVEELPRLRWPAMIAFVSACVVGIATSGLIPALASLRVGVSSLEAWTTAVVVYLGLRTLEHSRQSRKSRRLETLLPAEVPISVHE
jgi:purine-cytosine permease-like protein